MALYPYQEKVKELIQSGQSIVLQAPTGTGKTRAALAPFIEAFFDSPADQFPKKCIYSVPMRILAKQFEIEYQEYAEKYKRKFRREINVRIQTGDRPDDRQFESDLIFCTIDQSLSSLLSVPYALSSRKANLNSGAVIGAYLVFDEYHLFPSRLTEGGPEAFGTTLRMLELLKGLTPFCLMTATLSKEMLDQLSSILEAKVITVKETELEKIETGYYENPDNPKPRKERRFRVMDKSILDSVDDILKNLGKRTIVICNRVDRAQKLTQALENRLSKNRVMLLHARFNRTDRNKLEEKALKEFGKETETQKRIPSSLILVATQVIEVGLDISCDVMHTEVAPANAIIQRAGRCARRPGETGQVFIYPLPEISEVDKRPFLPYSKELCETTLTTFRQEIYQNIPIRFREEQEIINQVHTKADRKLLEALTTNKRTIDEKIGDALFFGDTGSRPDLIRKIDNVILLVHDNPVELGDPFACEGFAISPWSLQKKWVDLETWVEETEWDYPLMYPQEDDEAKRRNKELRKKKEAAGLPLDEDEPEPEYDWTQINNSSLIEKHRLLAIHPALVSYDSRYGFRLDEQGTTFRTEGRKSGKDKNDVFSYHLESYEAHIRQMMIIYRRDLQSQVAYAARWFEQLLGLETRTVETAIRLAIALHDVGKLQVGWQQWARTYQQEIGEGVPDFLVAHTHNEPHLYPHHKEAEKKANRLGRRPRHAGEGAAAVVDLVYEALGEREILDRVVLAAITRHHAPTADQYDNKFRLDKKAVETVEAALTAADISQASSLAEYLLTEAPDEELDIILEPQPGDPWRWWFLYYLVVRLVRLTDGKSQEVG